MLILFYLVLVEIASAQSSYTGFFPEAGITKNFGDRYGIFKIESQHELYKFNAEKERGLDYFHDRTDLQGFIGHQLNSHVKVAVGYQYRIQPSMNNHRSIQQVSWKSRLSRPIIDHRIRADQTFEVNQPFQWRIRYRFSYIHSYSESKYLLLSNEPIYALEGGISTYENRLVIAFGLKLPNGSKLQVGPDYRIDARFSEPIRTRLWWKAGWFIVL
ncbi:MAG: DUF2490 domain-containing protein [Cyclobacteriaceae bacterium]